MKIYKLPVNPNPHFATIRDKVRDSGLTSVRWVNDQFCVAASFSQKKLYLIELKGSELEIVFEADTISGNGIPVETDLMDFRENEILLTNFYLGTVSVYKLYKNKIKFVKELVFSKNTFLHGVRFIPGYEDLIWLTYCGINNKCHQIINYKTSKIIHNINLPEQAQDVGFIDNYAVVFARTNHITKGVLKKRFWRPLKKMYATAFIYKLPNNLLESEPVYVDFWKGDGHIDAVMEYEKKIYAANQYNNCVDIFELYGSKLELTKKINGFEMPHGLDIDSKGNVLVTNYLDNTLRQFSL